MSITFFFFNDTATTEIYTLSLHDALPIYGKNDSIFEELVMNFSTDRSDDGFTDLVMKTFQFASANPNPDRKSTRLNSSHANISYAVFCLKKKKNRKLYHNRT